MDYWQSIHLVEMVIESSCWWSFFERVVICSTTEKMTRLASPPSALLRHGIQLEPYLVCFTVSFVSIIALVHDILTRLTRFLSVHTSTIMGILSVDVLEKLVEMTKAATKSTCIRLVEADRFEAIIIIIIECHG